MFVVSGLFPAKPRFRPRLPHRDIDVNLPLSELGLASTLLKGSPLYAKAGKVSILCSLLQEAGHHRGNLLCGGGVVVGHALGIGGLRT